MTYNIRAGLGLDGKRSIERIAEVIRRHEPDIVALQEVDVDCPRSGRVHQAARLAELTERSFHFTHARSDARGRFGNATLTAWPLQVVSESALPVRFGETRTAQKLEILLPDQSSLQVVNTHLSIHLYERLLQTRALFASAPPAGSRLFSAAGLDTDRLVLCGDLNAGSLSLVYRAFARRLNDVQRKGPFASRTWPSPWPVLRLDHIWVGETISVRDAYVPRDTLTRVASDHLPLIAELALLAPGAQPQDAPA